jgi:hypothetical protein
MKRLAFFLFSLLLLASPARAQNPPQYHAELKVPKEFLHASPVPPPGGLIIQLMNGTTPLGTWVSYGVIQCSSGMTCQMVGSNFVMTSQGSANNPGGTAGQVEVNFGGTGFAGVTISGDCTLNTSTGAMTCTKTNGTAFGTAALANLLNSTSFPFQSLTTGGSGPATLSAGVLNIPTPPAATFTSLTTTGSSGAATLSGGVLNIPSYTGGGGTSLFSGLTPGTNTTAIPWEINPSTALGGSTPDFYILGATADTNTATVMNIDTPSGSQQSTLRIGNTGVSEFQVCWQPGPQGEIVIGSAVTCPNISQSPYAKFVAMSQTAAHTIQRDWQGSAAATGDMHEWNTATAAGTGFYFLKTYTGVTSTDTSSGGGTLGVSIRGDGLLTAPSIIDSGISASTSPICPNGTGGAFTTSGCSGGGGGSSAGSQYAIQYNSNGSGGFAGVTPPALQGIYYSAYSPTSTAAVAPAPLQVGIAQRSISGATSSDPVVYTDVGGVIEHDVAASVSNTESIPVPSTAVSSGGLGNAAFGFSYCNHSASIDTLAPAGSWTIQAGNSATASTLNVASGACWRITVDPKNATNWLADHSGVGGGDTITSPNSTLAVGGTSTNTTVDLNLAHSNLFTALQAAPTFNATSLTAAFQINGVNMLIQPDSDTTSIAIGPSAAAAQSATNSNNTVVGDLAFEYPTTSGYNVAVGGAAMQGVSGTPLTGGNNTAVGYLAAGVLQGGAHDDTAIGNDALEAATTPFADTAVGMLSLGSVTNGGGNTAVGYETGYAGTALTTGTYNSFFGYSARALTAADTNEIVVGSGSAGTVGLGSNSVNIGNVIEATGTSTPSTSTVTVPGAAVAGSYGTSGSNGGFSCPGGTGVNVFSPAGGTGLSGSDSLWCDSTANRWKMNNNNGGAVTVMSTSDSVVAAQMPALTGDVTSTAGAVATTVGALKGVPFCTGYTPTTGQTIAYTTASSPNPCYTAASGGTAKNGILQFSTLAFTSAYTFTSATSYYFGIGIVSAGPGMQTTETIVQTMAPFAGTAQNLYVHFGTAPTAGTSLVFTLRDNASSTAITCSWSSGLTCNDTTHTATIAQGDLLDISIVCTTGSGSCSSLFFNANANIQIQ